jgi:hypothetical protein
MTVLGKTLTKKGNGCGNLFRKNGKNASQSVENTTEPIAHDNGNRGNLDNRSI